MGGKNIDNKLKRHKKRVSSAVVAEVTGCGLSTVKMVLSGQRSQDTITGQRVVIANMLLEEKMDKMIEEVKRIVRL